MTNLSKTHFTEVYNIDIKERDIDFFDTNLEVDTKLFVDPFLLKRSLVDVEQKLYKRFYLYFMEGISRAKDIVVGRRTQKYLYNYLYFKEPKEVCLGYTEKSHSGSGLGSTFATSMTAFFLKGISHRIIESTNSEKSFNPEVFALFTNGVAQDGISDLTVSLIMDYLIKYTQNICNLYNIPLKELPIGNTFDYQEMEWTHGQNCLLPENLIKRGMPVVLVPKRLLRGSDVTISTIITTTIKVLSDDPILKDRFSDLIQKPLVDINIDEIKSVLINDKELLARFIELYSLKGNRDVYDFVRDPLEFLSIKNYSNYFDSKKLPKQPENCEGIYSLTTDLIRIFKEENELRDGWKDAWTKDGRGSYAEITEPAWGRKFRAMGTAYFKHFPEITFSGEFGTGNGFLDFIVIYKDCRICLELKKLSNASPKGDEKLKSYLHGFKIQLPSYSYSQNSKYAIYITGQHRRVHGERANEIRGLLPSIVNKLKKDIPDFQRLDYININLEPKPSASKI